MHQTFEQRVHMYLWILAVLLPLVGLYVADWRRRSRQLFRQVDGVLRPLDRPWPTAADPSAA